MSGTYSLLGGQKATVSVIGLKSSHAPLEALRESLFFASSGFYGCWHSLACGHITPVSASVVTLSSPHLSVFKFPSASLLEGYMCLYVGSTWKIQDHLSIPRSLITFAKTAPPPHFLPYKVTFTGSRD